MHKSYYMCIIMLAHSLCSGVIVDAISPTLQEQDAKSSELDLWYKRAKIAGIATLSVVAFLLYKRVSKTLDTMESLATNVRPMLADASATLAHMRATGQEFKDMMVAMRPAIADVPVVVQHIKAAVAATHVTLDNVQQAAEGARDIAARGIGHPGSQEAIQATATSVFAGFNAASTGPPTESWSPKNFIKALARHPDVAAAATNGLARGLLGQPVTPSPARVRAWRWCGWCRRK